MAKKVTKQNHTTKYPLFDFNLEEITKYSNNFENPEEAIEYLEFIKKEKYNADNPFILDAHSVLFLKKMDNELSYHHKMLELKIKTQSKIKKTLSLDKIDPIRWKGAETQIIYLFDLLFQNDFIDIGQFNNRFALISKHFLNKDNKKFDNKQLSKTQQNMSSNVDSKPKKSGEIEDIVNKLKST